MSKKTPAEVKAEMTAIYKQIDEDIDLSDDQRVKLIMTCAGMLEGMHTKLDHVRDVADEHDVRNPIDHNVEQAQISIEVTMMRLEQVARLLQDRMESDRLDALEDVLEPLFIARLEGKASLGGIADQVGLSHPEVEEMFKAWTAARAKLREGFEGFGQPSEDGGADEEQG